MGIRLRVVRFVSERMQSTLVCRPVAEVKVILVLDENFTTVKDVTFDKTDAETCLK